MIGVLYVTRPKQTIPTKNQVPIPYRVARGKNTCNYSNFMGHAVMEFLSFNFIVGGVV